MGRHRWELERKVRITGDEEVGIAYVRFVDSDKREGPVASVHVGDDEHGGPGLVLDFDRYGRLLGIELLDPVRQLHPDLESSRPVGSFRGAWWRRGRGS